MAQINREWHQTHKMPKNPTLEQRLAWHLDHASQCGCRDMPETIRQVMKARGIADPHVAVAPEKSG